MKVTEIEKRSLIGKLVIGILLFLCGVVILLIDTSIIDLLLIPTVMVVVLVWAIKKFVDLCNDENFSLAIFTLIICIIFAAALGVFSDFFFSITNIVLAVLAFAVAILRLFIVIQQISVGNRMFFRNILSVLACVLFGVLVLCISFQFGKAIIYLILGVYLILYSITYFGDFFAGITKKDLNDDRQNRRTHFALPNFVTALESTKIVRKYDKMLKEDDSLTTVTEIAKGNSLEDVNFSIMVHVSQILAKRMGHVDISIGDTVYTYGCYDSSKNKLGGFISKGTFVIMPKKPYLENCLSQQRKYVIEYGCKLSDEQLAAVKERIDEIFSHTTKQDISYDPNDNKAGSDGASTVAKLGGELYYVDDGPFQTYFAISSNCVQLADTIIGKAGLDAMSNNSLRTPGAYYKMMENQFYRPRTRVITKTAHLQNYPGEKRELKEKAEKKKK